mmetsp:Transcript_14130/g.26455  ORF Transcript_14130/g.26455 Transcript_14130/m.26455 type:complete len:312 (-) Transcript_14130:98-1033(-)
MNMSGLKLQLGTPQPSKARGQSGPGVINQMAANRSDLLSQPILSKPKSSQEVTPSPGSGRFSELTQRFHFIERQVQADTKSRKQTEDSTVENLWLDVQRLDDCIAQEAQVRTQKLQDMKKVILQPKLTEAQSKLEAAFLTQFEHIHSVLDAVNDRMSSVEKDFQQSRARYIGHMDMEASAIEQDLAEFKKAFDVERQNRQEREQSLRDRLDNAKRQTAEKLARDDQLAERKYAQLLRDADESVRERDREQQHFKEQVDAEIASLKVAIADASKARSQADDDIVAALNHYTKELQQAVSSVSHGALQAAMRS